VRTNVALDFYLLRAIDSIPTEVGALLLQAHTSAAFRTIPPRTRALSILQRYLINLHGSPIYPPPGAPSLPDDCVPCFSPTARSLPLRRPEVTEVFHIIAVPRSNSPEFIVKIYTPNSPRLSRRGTLVIADWIQAVISKSALLAQSVATTNPPSPHEADYCGAVQL
jgi:hypothetical protein